MGTTQDTQTIVFASIITKAPRKVYDPIVVNIANGSRGCSDLWAPDLSRLPRV